MRDFLLATHFIGLAIGAGTGVYLAAMGRWTVKHRGPPAVRDIMLGPGKAISDVGLVGLIVLVVSGLGLVSTNAGFSAMPTLFWLKLALVALILLYVFLMRRLAAQAQAETGPATLLRMKKFGPFGVLLAALTVVVAVMTFH